MFRCVGVTIMSLQKAFLALTTVAFVAGCGSSGGSDSGSAPNQDHKAFFASTADTTDYPIKSVCGAVIEEQLQQPIPLENLEEVTVQPLTLDRAIITRTEGEFAGLPQIIKLQGIIANPDPTLYAKGMELMTVGSTPYAYFVSAGNNCIIQTADGGSALLGQLISPDGYSFSEVERYYNTALPSVDVCGGEVLAQCYNAIGIPTTLTEEDRSPFEIDIYLWKPASDSDGNLVILTDVYDVTVSVGGEVGQGIGPSNGYGSTSRFTKPGCAYGSATVEFRDSNGKRIYTKDGQASLTGAGCSRDKKVFH